jgi:hypothetical protein
MALASCLQLLGVLSDLVRRVAPQNFDLRGCAVSQGVELGKRAHSGTSHTPSERSCMHVLEPHIHPSSVDACELVVRPVYDWLLVSW